MKSSPPRIEEMLQSILGAERNRAIEAALQKNRRQLARAQKQLYRSWYLVFRRSQ